MTASHPWRAATPARGTGRTSQSRTYTKIPTAGPAPFRSPTRRTDSSAHPMDPPIRLVVQAAYAQPPARSCCTQGQAGPALKLGETRSRHSAPVNPSACRRRKRPGGGLMAQLIASWALSTLMALLPPAREHGYPLRSGRSPWVDATAGQAGPPPGHEPHI